MADIQNNEPVAYFYELTGVGKELVLDCNGEYARKLLEAGYTETPLFTRAAPPAMDREAVERETIERCARVCDDLAQTRRGMMYPADHPLSGGIVDGMAERAAESFNRAASSIRTLSALSADAIRQGRGLDHWKDMGLAPRHDGAKIIGYDAKWGVAEMMLNGAKRWVLAAFNGQVIYCNPLKWQPLSATPAPAVDAKARADMAAALRNTPAEALREAGYLERAAQMIEAPAVDAVPAGEVERLARIRTSMALLQQNSEGCAQNHYGDDAAVHGMPGWLVDTKADLDAFTKILARREADCG